MKKVKSKFEYAITLLAYQISILIVLFASAVPGSGYEWTPLPAMNFFHTGGTMTVLGDGRVLLAGGAAGGPSDTHALAELFDPATRTFAPTGSLNQKRNGHCSVALPNGNLLVAGGSGGRVFPELKSVELYDAQTGQFTLIGNMSENRIFHPACTLLPDGEVILSGGAYEGSMGSGNITVDRFDSGSSNLTLNVGRLHAPRSGGGHSAVLINTGSILHVGGESSFGSFSLPALELYDPVSNKATVTRIQPTGGPGYYAAAALPDGKVIVMKKEEATYPEYYDPSGWQFETAVGAGAFTMHPTKSSLAVVHNGKVLFNTGLQLRIFDPAGGQVEVIDFPDRFGNGQCVELEDGDLFCANMDKKIAALLTLEK